MSQAQKLYLLYPFSLHLTTARLFIQRFLDSKKDSLGRTALFREGISGLYADCAMQVYYILAGLYGLCVWAKKPKPAERETGRIARTPARMWFRMAAAYAAIHALLYLLLVRFTDSTVPFWDSLTTALCIMAYWMLSRKYVEQWLVWLAVDVVTVGLYLYKDIPLTAGLYLLYSALAVAGYRRWLRRIGQ